MESHLWIPTDAPEPCDPAATARRCSAAAHAASSWAPLPSGVSWAFAPLVATFDPVLDFWLLGRAVVRSAASGFCPADASSLVPAAGASADDLDDSPSVAPGTAPVAGPTLLVRAETPDASVLSLLPLPGSVFVPPTDRVATDAVCAVLRLVGPGAFDVEETCDRIIFEATRLAG